MTAAEIAEEVGCSRSSVYRYIDMLFPNLPVLPSSGIPAAAPRLPQAKAEAVIDAMRWAGFGPAGKAPGPKVEELAEKLGVSRATAHRYARGLCPGRNVRLTPAEVAALTQKVKDMRSTPNPNLFRPARAPAKTYTVTLLAKELGVSRTALRNAVSRLFPSKRGPRMQAGGTRPAIIITAGEVDAVKAEVERVRGLGRPPQPPNGQRLPRQGKPKAPKPVTVHPPSELEDGLPPIEDVVMSVLEGEGRPSPSTPARCISLGNLARAFKWDPDDLRFMVYTKFPGMLALPGEPSTALSPNELLHCIVTGLRSAGGEGAAVQR